VPRATYLAVSLITGFFALTAWMFISSYGPSQAAERAGAALEAGDSAAFVFEAMAGRLGDWTSVVLPVLLASSLLAGVLAFHNSINRYLFSLSRDGLLPSAIDRVNKHGAPHVASVIQTVSAVLFVMPFALARADPVLTLFSWFSGAAVLCAMVLYVLTSISVLVYFARTRTDTRLWQTRVAPALATIAILGVIGLILTNFTTLLGGSQAAALILALSVPAVFVLGVVLAVVRRSSTGAGHDQSGSQTNSIAGLHT
jgi:amino acid transporter